MGFGGISIWQLLIVLVIVILLFGTKKLKNLGSDLGGAIKNFRGAVRDGEAEPHGEDDPNKPQQLGQPTPVQPGNTKPVIDVQASNKDGRVG